MQNVNWRLILIVLVVSVVVIWALPEPPERKWQDEMSPEVKSAMDGWLKSRMTPPPDEEPIKPLTKEKVPVFEDEKD